MAPHRKRPVSTLDDLRGGNEVLKDTSSFASIRNPPTFLTSVKRSANLATASYSGFCQPAICSSGGNHIPCYVIPGMPQVDVCKTILQRVHQEFLPIIQRRGYNVQSISEICCCGDGLDISTGNNSTTQPGQRGPLRKRVSDSVLGYNAKSWSSTGDGQNRHTIHLRLRHPRQHQRLFSWEDVAGTMAHELAHCVHWSHDEKFFHLMEEIMEEYYQLQLQRGPMSGDTGHRLGGNHKHGKSRLIHDFESGPNRLSGGGALGIRGGRILSLTERRQLTANAAEARQRQIQQVRRMVERNNLSCVIEILDDDDDSCDDHNHIQPTSQGSWNNDVGDRGLPFKPSNTEKRQSNGRRFLQEGSSRVIDLSDVSIPSGTTFLECGRCTFQNNPKANQCTICHSELTGTGLDCGRCTFRNDMGNTICQVCSSNLT
jgi:hypothetical protein